MTIDNIIPKEILPLETPLKYLRYKGVGFVLVLLAGHYSRVSQFLLYCEPHLCAV